MLQKALPRFLALTVVSLACGMFHPNGSKAETGTTEIDRTACVISGKILYISGLILQGGEDRFYLLADKPTCVVSESGEDWVIRTQLIELQCHDDSWNGHERQRGETTEFRGEIGAIAPDRVYLSCHI